MRFKVDNLNVCFEYENEEFLGDSTLSIPKEVLIGFLDHNEIEYDLEECTIEETAIEYGCDEIEYWMEDQEDKFNSTHSDLHILLYEYMVEYSGLEEIDIEYWGSNHFWILHDICHSRKDITGGTIYVNGEIEEERIYEGMELAKEVGILNCVDIELFHKCSEGLKERFGNQLDLDRVLQILNS